PGIRLEILQGSNHAFLNRKPRCPPKGAHLGTVEEYERTVANPTSLAARIIECRLDPEMIADPSNRLPDLAILIRAQIEDGYLLRRFFDRKQNRVNAVLDVQVRLALLPVPQ